MREKIIVEIETEGTTVELQPTDFAVVISQDGNVTQYVPGDPSIQNQGVTLEAAVGMSTVASLFSSIVGTLLETAIGEEEEKTE